MIACSDGGYLGTGGQMQALARELHDLNVITVGIGLTETAAEVPIVMNNPPYSRGDIAKDINDLPVIVAKHVIQELIKLFPKKAQKNAEEMIKNALKKY